MNNLFPEVVQAIAGENYIVYAYMKDGSVRLFDAKPLINKGGVFAKLRDKTFFADNLTVMNETVAWDILGNHNPSDCIDIDPFTIAACPETEDILDCGA